MDIEKYNMKHSITKIKPWTVLCRLHKTNRGLLRNELFNYQTQTIDYGLLKIKYSLPKPTVDCGLSNPTTLYEKPLPYQSVHKYATQNDLSALGLDLEINGHLYRHQNILKHY